MCKNTCCFIGHREITETKELKIKLEVIIEKLIAENSVDTFLFGSKSRFNDLCLEIVSELKEKYPDVKRIYVGAEYPYINDNYKKYLLESYEDTYFPKNITEAGKAVYIERNFEMIDKSGFCVLYYDTENATTNRKSGTKIAIDYAVKKGEKVINVGIK